MNNETALIVTIGIVVLMIALVFSFSDTILDNVKETLIGNEDDDGVIDCNPVENGSDCPEETALEHESFKLHDERGVAT